MNPLYDYLDYETVPQKSATQINHSNEILTPTQPMANNKNKNNNKSIYKCMNAWGVIAAVSPGGRFRRQTTENIN